MSVYFVLEFRIFVMMKNTNDVCYFVLKMFVMMETLVMSDFYVCCHFLYCILLLDSNYRQYLVRYIIFIYIR